MCIRDRPVVSETLAAGDPFNGADLSDPLGAYYGTTRSGGSVFLDLAFNDGKKRFSYNGIIAGTTGSGKSTFLKKAIQDRVSRGDFVRGFDVTGEFTSLVKTLGGKIISLDGSGGILNPLEIMKTDESDTLSWTRPISKLSILFRFWAPASDMYDVLAYESLLSELYLQLSLIHIYPSNVEPIVNNTRKGFIEIIKKSVLPETHKGLFIPSGLPVGGAVYGIFTPDGTQVDELITNEEGYAKSSLIPHGNYYVAELVPPFGMELDLSLIHI